MQLFQAISCYKKTDDYDKLAVDMVDLFKDNFSLLVSKLHSRVLYFEYLHFCSNSLCLLGEGFGVFIRPHHKKQYAQMLDGLVAQSAADDHAAFKDQEKQGKEHLTLIHTMTVYTSVLSQPR